MQSIDKAWVIDNDGNVEIPQPKEQLSDLFQREVVVCSAELLVRRFCPGNDTGYCRTPRECDKEGKCLA